jgi:hypothetical protein
MAPDARAGTPTRHPTGAWANRARRRRCPVNPRRGRKRGSALSYWGLHCFPDPALAVTEATRCLRPGGGLTGCTITRGRSWRHRLLVQPGRGGFGPGGTVEDLRHWLVDARLEALTVESSGLFAYFEAVSRHEGRRALYLLSCPGSACHLTTSGVTRSHQSGCLRHRTGHRCHGRPTRASSARVQTTASPRRSGSAVALALVPEVAVDQSRSPALGRPPAGPRRPRSTSPRSVSRVPGRDGR